MKRLVNRSFAIGDIHGCCRTFKYLLFEKLKITHDDKIYCLGDYIDRGPDSKGVVDLILSLRKNGYNIHTLRGNHEQMFMDSVRGFSDFVLWMSNGGESTLKSFNIMSFNELPPYYQQFFKHTKYYIKTGDVIFVHAGIDLSVENPFKDKYSMLWSRDLFNSEPPPKGTKIIHGHTPISLNSIRRSLATWCINIDNGCVYKHYKDLGNLVAFDLTENRLIAIENMD